MVNEYVASKVVMAHVAKVMANSQKLAFLALSCNQ